MLASKLLPLLLLPCALGAQKAPAMPSLSITVEPTVVAFDIAYANSPFLGAVLVSFSPDLAHYLVGLPPLLADSAVLGIGIGQKTLHIAVPEEQIPPGVFVYAQGVVLDNSALLTTKVGSVVLDVTHNG